jgi:hypothetical protein
VVVRGLHLADSVELSVPCSLLEIDTHRFAEALLRPKVPAGRFLFVCFPVSAHAQLLQHTPLTLRR